MDSFPEVQVGSGSLLFADSAEPRCPFCHRPGLALSLPASCKVRLRLCLGAGTPGMMGADINN